MLIRRTFVSGSVRLIELTRRKHPGRRIPAQIWILTAIGLERVLGAAPDHVEQAGGAGALTGRGEVDATVTDVSPRLVSRHTCPRWMYRYRAVTSRPWDAGPAFRTCSQTVPLSRFCGSVATISLDHMSGAGGIIGLGAERCRRLEPTDGAAGAEESSNDEVPDLVPR